MKPFSIIVIVILTLFTACKKNSTGIEDNLPPTENELNHFQVSQFAYDSLQVSNNSDLILTSKAVKSIQVGYTSNSTFFVIQELPAQYQSSGKRYLLKFDFRFAVDKTIVDYPFHLYRLQFHGF